MQLPISVTVLAKNSERLIEDCLNALRPFGQVVLLDNGSTDKTLLIAAAFPNVKIVKSDVEGFGPLKNLAADHAENQWVLNVDSDEVLSDGLIREIAHLQLDEHAVYSIPRENFFNGKLIRCCGWHPDRVLRLYNRRHTAFKPKLLHESLVLKSDTRIKPLKNAMRHYSYRNASDFLSKLHRYAELYARENAGAKKSGPTKAVSHALYTFVRNYFFQRGFLYGYAGLLISVSNATGVFYKYVMLHEKNRA